MSKCILLHVHHPAGRKSLFRVSMILAGSQTEDHVEDGAEECKAKAEQNSVTMTVSPHTVEIRLSIKGTASPASVYPLMLFETNAETIPAAHTIQKYEVFHAILYVQ